MEYKLNIPKCHIDLYLNGNENSTTVFLLCLVDDARCYLRINAVTPLSSPLIICQITSPWTEWITNASTTKIYTLVMMKNCCSRANKTTLINHLDMIFVKVGLYFYTKPGQVYFKWWRFCLLNKQGLEWSWPWNGPAQLSVNISYSKSNPNISKSHLEIDPYSRNGDQDLELDI